MRSSWSTLPHQLRIAGIALLAAWVTVLSWSVLTAGFARVGVRRRAVHGQDVLLMDAVRPDAV